MQGVNPPAAVDHAWEECKENFKPIKDGRKAEALHKSSVGALKSVLHDKTVEQERRKYIQDIQDYCGEDPLDPWLQYIKWTKETFSAGGHKSELLPLLERCTREFHQDARYKNDIRYLRVWIQYADCLPDPSDIFAFLRDREIGQMHALFYIAYATFSELKGNYSDADSAYQKGIDKGAAPAERLEQKFKEFQHRMVRRIQRKASEQSHRSDAHHERKSLKMLKGPKMGSSRRREAASSAGGGPASNSNTIPVFVDEEFSSTRPPLRVRSASPPQGNMPLPSFDQSRKENIQSAVPWVGEKIKQKRSEKTLKPEETLAVLEDPQLTAIHPTSKKIISSPHLRQHLDSSNLDARISADPLGLIMNPSKAADFEPLSKETESEESDENLPQKQPKSTLTSPFEDEEVIHAAEQDRPLDNDDMTMTTRDAVKALNCLFTGVNREEERVPQASEEWELEPTMTINTRDALNAVNNMFQDNFSMASSNIADKDCSDPSSVPSDGGMSHADGTEQQHAALQANATTDSDFIIREDTVFLSNCASISQAGDTAAITHDVIDRAGGSPSHLPGTDDTVYIGRASIAAPGDDATVQINSRAVILDQETQECEVFDDENIAPGFTPQVSRRTRKHCPLAPLDAQQLAAEAIEIEHDEEAEQALKNQVIQEGEGFTVFEDEEIHVLSTINPFERQFQMDMIASLNLPIQEWPDVIAQSGEESEELERQIQKARRNNSSRVHLGGLLIDSLEKIGAGSYATVYGGRAVDDETRLAVKVEYPTCPWEWLLCKALAGRNEQRDLSVLMPKIMCLGNELSAMVMPLCEYGTLQDLLNDHLKVGKRLDETIVAGISMHMFQSMSQLHGSKILHNDIKPDNIIFGFSENAKDVIIKLIDLGRGVDIEMLPPDTQLVGDSGTEAFRCVQMRESKPWLWQSDLYNVACTIHCLIFGEYMEVDRVTNQNTGETFIRRRATLPRVWNQNLWNEIFHILLNYGSLDPEDPPDWAGMSASMSSWVNQESVNKRYESELEKLAARYEKKIVN
eukprot:jgi/Picsp_1/2236/NSC_05700-R1_protein